MHIELRGDEWLVLAVAAKTGVDLQLGVLPLDRAAALSGSHLHHELFQKLEAHASFGFLNCAQCGFDLRKIRRLAGIAGRRSNQPGLETNRRGCGRLACSDVFEKLLRATLDGRWRGQQDLPAGRKAHLPERGGERGPQSIGGFHRDVGAHVVAAQDVPFGSTPGVCRQQGPYGKNHARYQPDEASTDRTHVAPLRWVLRLLFFFYP